jgi:DNA-binding PadR family transcriptional regulator
MAKDLSELLDFAPNHLAWPMKPNVVERLGKKGLVSSRIGSGTPVRDGRARRFYRMQPAGLRALNQARAAVNNLWHGLKWPLKGLHYDNA